MIESYPMSTAFSRSYYKEKSDSSSPLISHFAYYLCTFYQLNKVI